MCRWLAYAGAPVFVESLLFRPEHSLIDQSQHAQQTIYTVNGDGYGLGWYGDRSFPGVYRDVRPAWNDENLRRLAEQIRSRLFLAHVRQTTGSPVQRTNCHPFRHGPWLFQHNGLIQDYDVVKRRLLMAIDPELLPHLHGSTDSEVLFYLALTHGLDDDPPRALRRMAGEVEAAREEAGITAPFRMSIAATEGGAIYGARFSSDHASAGTLYVGQDVHSLRELTGGSHDLPPECALLLSEPLDRVSENWKALPEGALVTVKPGHFQQESFGPER